MSEKPGPSRQNPVNTDDEDDRLNFYSDNFDPLLFLTSERTKIPKPDAQTFDNLAMWHSHYNRPANEKKKEIPKELPARRWLPHQLPIQSKKPTRIFTDVFTRMEATKGPLATLRKYIEEKTRIKVVTANPRGIRGYCLANLLMFDKHFNLVLQNVEEVWQRSITIKKDPILTDLFPEDPSRQRNSRNRIRLPKMETKKLKKNTEECRRRVDQMLMRGEQVVLICAASNEKK
ncbi:unnamed protein product [Ceutorhynchus assimilis]|uniref:Sm domain-containing protein n=1 Tax=Ceutorhynchus assimilis TaxID=467358 RepID=A0A9N9QRR1_9CUCU|nr:unnamed protein product [Ceutorhynchus assimilis]